MAVLLVGLPNRSCRSGAAGVSSSTLHLPVLAANSAVEVAWICDLDLSKAKSIAKRFSVPNSFTEIDQCPDVEIVDRKSTRLNSSHW